MVLDIQLIYVQFKVWQRIRIIYDNRNDYTRVYDHESNKQKIISLTEEIKLKQGEIQRLNSLIIKFGNMYNFPLNIIFRSMNGAINCFVIFTR